MPFTNIEIKARTTRQVEIRNYLEYQSADFKGVDHQTDTYFVVPFGRLKLRQGNIENTLIAYERHNDPGPKKSAFSLVEVLDGDALKEILKNSLGILTVVKKQREIYFIDNVKFHLDTVPTLGEFVEIEASNKFKPVPDETLKQQCEFYMKEFLIEGKDLVNNSYSDMMLTGHFL